MSRFIFGVDVGGTTVKLGFFDMEGNVLDKWEIPTRTEESGSKIIPDIAKSILSKIKEKGIEKSSYAITFAVTRGNEKVFTKSDKP